MRKKIITSLILLVLLFIGASSCYAETKPSFINDSGIFQYAVMDGNVIIIDYINRDGASNVKIPDEIKGMPVVSINSGVFFDDVEGVLSINIPKSVKYIEDGAFVYCPDTISVSFGNRNDEPTGIMECNIGKKYGAFSSCDSVEELWIYQDIPAFSVDMNANDEYSPENLGIKNLKTIHAHKGSWAEGYAKKYNLKFKPIINFNDVNYTSWYYKAVQYSFDNEIIKGIDSTHFAPNQKLTRGMIATILWRMEGSPENNGKSKFTDVDSSTWYSQAVKWAVDNKIVNGYSGTKKFGPKDYITRQDLAVILRNYANYKGKNMNATLYLTSFKDVDKISNYAKSAMQWAVENGVITGNTKTNTLNPKGNATRAEAASMIQKYCMNVGR